jgi:hypothetical protein
MAPHGQDDPWEIYSASAIGADHVRARMPNQDSVLTNRVREPGGPSLPVFAVADGHGHIRHFRSDRGSLFAVNATISVVREWTAALPNAAAPTAADASRLVSGIVARWRELVAEDLADNPITDFEAVALVPNDPPEIPYGSTLLIGVLTPQVALLGQVGDGEIFLILPDGRELSPVPSDSRLTGTQTTSLCQPDAVSSFRVALVNLTKTPVFGVFASTDGYGNAQAEENWRQTFAADLVRLGRAHDIGWIGGELPSWAATCASSDGSGDDTTAAMLLNTQVALAPPSAQPLPPPAGPGRTLAYDTIPGDDQTRRLDHAATAEQRRPAVAQGPGSVGVDAGAGAGGSRPTVPAFQRPPPSWEPGRAQPPRAAAGALVLQPKFWLPGALVLGLAVALVLVFAFHSPGAKSPIPQTGATTLPPSHPGKSGRPTATPTTRNSGTSTPTPTPSPLVNPARRRDVSEPMARHAGFTVPLPIRFPVPVPPVSIPPGLFNPSSASIPSLSGLIFTGDGRQND